MSIPAACIAFQSRCCILKDNSLVNVPDVVASISTMVAEPSLGACHIGVVSSFQFASAGTVVEKWFTEAAEVVPVNVIVLVAEAIPIPPAPISDLSARLAMVLSRYMGMPVPMLVPDAWFVIVIVDAAEEIVIAVPGTKVLSNKLAPLFSLYIGMPVPRLSPSLTPPNPDAAIPAPSDAHVGVGLAEESSHKADVSCWYPSLLAPPANLDAGAPTLLASSANEN